MQWRRGVGARAVEPAVERRSERNVRVSLQTKTSASRFITSVFPGNDFDFGTTVPSGLAVPAVSVADDPDRKPRPGRRA